MRIMYFSEGYTTHDRRFLNRLAEFNDEIWWLRLLNRVDNFDRRALPTSIQTISWSGVEPGKHTPESWLRLMPEYSSIVREISPDLIQAGPVPSCGWMTALSGYHPFLVSSWGSDVLVDAGRDKFWTWLTQYTLQRADAVLCDCLAVKNKIKELAAYPDEKIVSFPWGIDLSRFNESSPPSRGYRPLHWSDSFVVICTRSWEKIYGIDVVLESFNSAYRKNPTLRLMLIGNGSEAEEVHRFLECHQLADVVSLPGRIPEDQLPDYLRGADLYLSCSHSDGSSISLLEAMAIGLPVIVTDIPSNREWVTHGDNGWLAGDGNVEEFCDRLLYAIGLDRDSAQLIASKNKKIVRDRADWHKNSCLLKDLYAQLNETHRHE